MAESGLEVYRRPPTSASVDLERAISGRVPSQASVRKKIARLSYKGMLQMKTRWDFFRGLSRFNFRTMEVSLDPCNLTTTHLEI